MSPEKKSLSQISQVKLSKAQTSTSARLKVSFTSSVAQNVENIMGWQVVPRVPESSITF